MNIDLHKVTLTRGSHSSIEEGFCARELLHYMVVGAHADATPPCLTVCCAILPVLNDAKWLDDAHRTAALMPYLPRLMECKRDKSKDLIRAFRLADIAVRIIAAEALEGVGVEHSLRALDSIVDAVTARNAYTAVDITAYVGASLVAACTAARSAACTAANAATAADGGAACVAYTATYAATAARLADVNIERHARLLLDAVVAV